jgi:hypothetical protein
MACFTYEGCVMLVLKNVPVIFSLTLPLNEGGFFSRKPNQVYPAAFAAETLLVTKLIIPTLKLPPV